ncbi:hypothetical protein [Lysobacter gummosus]|uniref:hypothetical protein n=1 Tax=Lysobacter gummosus TaxID=262324 RepID=UPI00363FB6F7
MRWRAALTRTASTGASPRSSREAALAARVPILRAHEARQFVLSAGRRRRFRRGI